MPGHNFGVGFVTAGLGTSFGNIFPDANATERVLGAALIGGTASKLTGGKFANGAATAAFSAVAGEMGASGFAESRGMPLKANLNDAQRVQIDSEVAKVNDLAGLNVGTTADEVATFLSKETQSLRSLNIEFSANIQKVGDG